ncbi:MAG: hypothetical protein HUU21_04985 [Polyangiaceae bacterium]|nr:hypothetical protein [Polyangiaceae bacterium]
MPEPGALRLTHTIRAQRRAARMCFRALTEAEGSESMGRLGGITGEVFSSSDDLIERDDPFVDQRSPTGGALRW